MKNTVIFQRIENAAILIAATGVYYANHLNWVWYGVPNKIENPVV